MNIQRLSIVSFASFVVFATGCIAPHDDKSGDAPKQEPAQSGDQPKTDDKTPSTPPPVTPTGAQGLKTLDVDCNDTANNASPKCSVQVSGLGGQLGKGFTWAKDPNAMLRGGFIDEAHNRLVVALELQYQNDDKGVVVGIDLMTGDRTVISGTYEDAATGPVTVGAGDDSNLGNIYDVQPMPDGLHYMAVMTNGTQQGTQLVKIEAATGNRTLVSSGTQVNVGGVRIVGTPCAFDDGTKVTQFTPSGNQLAISADGGVYLSMTSPSTRAIVRFDEVAAQEASCKFVMYANDSDKKHAKGTGPTISGGDQLRGLRFHDGKLFAVATLSEKLLAFDFTTNKYVSISSATAGQGAGDAQVGRSSIDFQPDGSLLTFGAFVHEWNLTTVDAATGARTGITRTAGPASSNGTGAWHVPGSTLIMLAPEHDGIVLLDPATGNSNRFSI